MTSKGVSRERRGAAHGIAGIVKGLGFTSLRKFNLIPTLQEYTEDQKKPQARQGALFTVTNFQLNIMLISTVRIVKPWASQNVRTICYSNSS